MEEKPFLHLGDLAQLNEINLDKQYRIAQGIIVQGDWKLQGDWKQTQEEAENSLLERLAEQNYAGACNVTCLTRAVAEKMEYQLPSGQDVTSARLLTELNTEYRYLGTPVIKREKDPCSYIGRNS